MRQFITEDDLHPMARALDPNTAAASKSAGGPGSADAAPGAEAAPAVRHVCPFCGSLNASPTGPCPRCTMENTSQTRTATKSRIGPWYVLQARNPAAPGMKFETLLGFVRKGRVKPESIVRGPTTQQLWRRASQVKGLSREFALCYSCGGSIAADAAICARCNRLQEPPANPDTLLEGEAEPSRPPTAPVFKEIKAASPVADDIVVPALGASAAGGVVEAEVFTSEDAADAHAPAATGGTPARSATDLPDEADDVEKPFNVNDLAAAFQSNPASVAAAGGGGYEGIDGGFGGGAFGGGFGGGRPDVPAIFGVGGGYSPRRNFARPLGLLVLVVLLGLGLWLMFDDISRRRTLEWFSDAYGAVRRTGEDAAIGGHRKTAPGPADGRSAMTPERPAETNEASTPDDLSSDVPAVTDADPLADDPMEEITAPDDPLAPPGDEVEPATQGIAAPDEGEYPRIEPEEVAEVAPAPVPEPEKLPARDVKAEADALFSAALDAEAAHEFDEALRLLGEIRRLPGKPADVWPNNLEVVINRVEKRKAKRGS